MKTIPYEIKLTYVIAILIMMFFVGFIVFVVLMYNKRQLFFIQQQKLKEAEHENQLLQKELERQKSIEQERERISHDVHDDIGARISALKLQGEFIKQNFSSDAKLQKELDEMMKTTEEMTTAMREMIWSLKTQNDHLKNFTQFSTKYAQDFFSKTNIHLIIENKIGNTDQNLRAETRRNLFLCYKEAINNIYKHSKATEVKVIFNFENQEFKFEVHDNGIGFKSDEVALGNGLYNMQHRMKEISGELLIPETEKGTVLIFSCKL